MSPPERRVLYMAKDVVEVAIDIVAWTL